MASLYVPDFSKIFAQNASSIQNWSDADYNTGWGFLGQEPPPYELFDDLFRKNDQKNKYLFDEVTDAKSRLTAAESGIQTLNSSLNTVTTNYLSKLTGGTVSGATTFSGNLSASRTLSTTDKSLYVPNTTWVHNLINYFLTTANNTQNNAFKTAVQEAINAGYHGITQDFSNPNAWWCKFPNGLIIQGGATGRPSGNAATAKFAISFSNTDYIIIPVGVIDADDTKWGLTVNVLKNYKTAETCAFRTSDAIAPACYYLAFGKATA